MIQDLTCRAPAQLWMSGSSDKDDSKIGDIFSYKRKDGVDIFANVSSDQPMVNWWFGARWFGIPRIPETERICYLAVSLECQTTGPQTTN